MVLIGPQAWKPVWNDGNVITGQDKPSELWKKPLVLKMWARFAGAERKVRDKAKRWVSMAEKRAVRDRVFDSKNKPAEL